MNKLIKRLKLERKRNNLTQKELANIFNTDKSTISKYENGHNKPDIDILKQYANHFEVSTDYLLGRTNARNLTSKIIMNEDLAEKCEKLIDNDLIVDLINEIQDITESDLKKIIKIIKAFK